MKKTILSTRAMYNKKLKRYLRYQLKDWRDQKLREANYTCFITGKKNCKGNRFPLDVHHHQITFGEILDESLKALNLVFHEFTTSYTEEELQSLVDEVIARHKDTPVLVLSRDAHETLHQRYGNNPTIEDVKEYKKHYRRRVINSINGNQKKQKKK
jgi:hypothetical protein